MDYGHRESDRRLAELERRIEREYKQAYKEVKAKTDKFFEKFEKTDKEMAQKVKQGEISKTEYINWRKKAMIKGKSLKDLEQSLAKDLVQADRIATEMISGHKVDIYTLNRNYGEYEVENGTKLDLGFSLYNTKATERLIKDQPALLPTQLDEDRDLKWNRQKVSSAITQGILQGESIPNISKRLRTVVGMDRTASIRNARTATTSAENAARNDSYAEAESKGIELEKEWLAVLDLRTRYEHRQLDRQTCPVHGAFEIDGEQIRFPGDPEAPGYLVYNCRCRLVSSIKGIEYKSKRWSRLPEGMSYEEWKGYKQNSEDVNETRLKAIQNIERQDRKLSYEKGAVISNEGKILARYDGTAHAVEVTDNDLKLMEGATFTHNHPNGGFFSNNDIITGFTKTNLQELRASTPQGITYSLINNGVTKESARKYLAEYQQTSMRAQRTAQEHFIRQIKSGELSMDEYKRNYFALFSQYRDEKLIKMTQEKASDFGFIFEVIKDEE